MAGAKAPLTFRIFKGDQLIREERLSLSVIKIGKVPSAHLKLDDETVSRMHAIIEVNGPGDVSIIDLGSTKGTFVNGQKVNKAKLQSGDTIVVGDTKIELAIGASEEASDEPTKVNTAAAPAPEVMSSSPRPVNPMAQTMPTSPPIPAARPPAPPPAFSAAPPPAPSAASAPTFQAAPPASYAAPTAPAPSGGLRPPPGMAGGAPLYGTAMAPPANFQTSMAESVDEVGGARAVEVAAMLGDSVVAVKHCMDPRGGKITTTTYGLFGAGIVAFLVAAFSFYMAVSNADYNEKGKHYWTSCLRSADEAEFKQLESKHGLSTLGKNVRPTSFPTTIKEPTCTIRPAHAFRPRELWIGYDFLMFGGFLLAIGTLTAGLARMRQESKSPFYRIGTATGVEFPLESSPAPDFAMVAPHGDDFAFHFGPGMEGEMVANGQTTSLTELASQGRTSISPIPPGAKIRVRSGKATFLVSAVPQPRRQMAAMFAALESRVMSYFAGSLAVHLGFWLILEQIPVEDSNVNLELASQETTSTSSSSTSTDDPPPPEEEEKPDDGADESGGTGTAMALEEGKMGKKDSDRAEGQYKMKKNQEDPQLARQQAIEQARTAGFLGSSALQQGGDFSSLTGTGDISSGFDDTNIYGGLLGNEAGEMQGGFGYGRSGFGPGGGGTGWGTIGTGRYGTIGHGSGTGSGYGVGGGRGGMRGRSSAVPSVSIGQPQATGDLDKAIIRRYIKRNHQKFQYCYEKELMVKPDLKGTVMASFLITGSGSVQSASGNGVDGEVASCVASVIKNIQFPAPKNGGNVQVNYPFVFNRAGG